MVEQEIDEAPYVADYEASIAEEGNDWPAGGIVHSELSNHLADAAVAEAQRQADEQK